MKKTKRILVIDIGGTHVKLMMSRNDKRKFDSGPRMTPKQMVGKIKSTVADWKFDAISIGFPAPVRHGRIMCDPKHLGKGWAGFDFRKALGKPVQVIIHKADGKDVTIQANHSMTEQQIAWFKAGSALNALN